MNYIEASLADDYPASAATTGTVAVNGSASGTLETVDDQDWFRIDLDANHLYRIDLLGATSGHGTLSDPYLYLRNDAGTLVAWDDDAGGGLNSRLTFRAPADGTWFIDVGSFIDHSSGTYLIRLTDLAGLNLVGTPGNDLLVGSSGFDTISGLGGDDTVLGGLGSDSIDGGEGRDTLHGGGDSDTLRGGAGNDLLDGGTGLDRMEGGAGDDRYVVLTTGDTVVESAGAGRDTVIVSQSNHTLAANVERLEMRGTLDLLGSGNASANILLGNDGNNVLSGGRGNDLLDGRGGADGLVGGAGADTFRFSTAPAAGAVDRLVDFNVAEDRVALDDAVFAAIGPLGALDPDAFHVGAAAADASDRIVYDSTDGRLFYDADGNGAGAAVPFATITAHTALTAADFWVV